MEEKETQLATGTDAPITQEAIDKAVGDLTSILNKLGRPLWAMISLVVIVLLIGFVTILLSSYALVMQSNDVRAANEAQLNNNISLLLAKLK